MRPRVAILEVSHWHVPIYLGALAECAQVVAVSDRDPGVAGKVATTFGARPYADWRALLEGQNLDLVFAFGRHCEMAEIARNLIERRLPFMIEKPAGISLTEVSQIATLSQQYGVPATTAIVQRIGPLPEWFSRVGELDYAAFRYVAGLPSRYPRAGCAWMLDPAESGGGCLINLSPHYIDIFRRLANEPVTKVVGRMHRRAHGLPIEDHAVIVLETSSGRSALIEVGYIFPDSPRTREMSYCASGANGFVSIADDGTAVFTKATGGSIVEHIDINPEPLYAEFTRRVVASFKTGFAGLPTLSDLEATIAIIERAYASAGTG